MILTKAYRRRMMPLEEMSISKDDIECQRKAWKETGSQNRRYYSNPWFFYKSKRLHKDVAFLVISAAYCILTLNMLLARCSRMIKHPQRQVTVHSLFFYQVNNPLETTNNEQPDYGGLLFTSLRNATTYSRKISMDSEYRENDSGMVDHELQSHENMSSSGDSCRPPSWQSRFYPTCNIMYEGNYVADSTSYRIGNGYYREAWLVNNTEMSVMKVLKLRHNVDWDVMRQVNQDAVIMERLTSSPQIMDMYSLCGTSLAVKFMPFTIENTIVPPGNWDSNYEPRNDLSPDMKLQFALEMAESLADLHGYEGGVIVHGDVQLGQWLKETPNSTLVLGDFNLAKVLAWDERKQRYCKYENGRGHGNYRAPEEVQSKQLDEKIDVFSFGNNVWSLLSGHKVFFESSTKEAQKQTMNGFMAVAREKYQNRSYAEGKLVELLHHCWEFHASKRIDMFEVVDFLREALNRDKQHRE